MDPFIAWWDATTFKHGDEYAIFAPQAWWNRLFELLEEGQMIPDACSLASIEHRVNVTYRLLKLAMRAHPELEMRIGLAKSRRRMAARKTVGAALENSVRDAQWYLERTDSEFLPKQDFSGLSKLDDDELKRIAFDESATEAGGPDGAGPSEDQSA